MKLLAIDWGRFLGVLPAWEGLTPAARLFLLEAKPRAVFPCEAAGDELDSLIANEFVSALADGDRARLTDDFHESHKVLRALARHPLHERSDERALRAYVGDHFTNAERSALVDAQEWIPNREHRLPSQIASAAHVRSLLTAEDVRAWEQDFLPPHSDGSAEREWTQSRSLLMAPHAPADLVALVREILFAGGAKPFHALTRPDDSRARLGATVEAALRYLVCFAVLDDELRPVLMLLPGVAGRLLRKPAPQPAVVRPRTEFDAILRLEDVTQLLVCAAEPLRLKNDGHTLFAAAEQRVHEHLLPLPDWMLHAQVFPENAPERRLNAARGLAESLGLLERRGEAGRDLALVTSAAGLDWLSQPPKERLGVLLRCVRFEAEGQDASEGKPLRAQAELLAELSRQIESPPAADELEDPLDEDFDADLEEEPFELVPSDRRRQHALGDEALFGFSAGGKLTRVAFRAYASLVPGQPVAVRDFLLHHAQHENPLPDLEALLRSSRRTYWGPPTEEELEAAWTEALARVLHDHLLPYGGARAGVGAGGMTMELTSIGRYLLGLADDFEHAAAPGGAKPVRVQPDFEVVFVAESPALEAAIGRFAERRGRVVGVLFRITRESIVGAARVGIGAEEVLATLAGASATPVPANVAHEVRTWSERCRRIALERAEILRCPDEATAVRVLAAAGAGLLERLSPTVLALLDPGHRAALVKQCRRAGIFLEERGKAPSAKWPGTGTRRSWR